MYIISFYKAGFQLVLHPLNLAGFSIDFIYPSGIIPL